MFAAVRLSGTSPRHAAIVIDACPRGNYFHRSFIARLVLPVTRGRVQIAPLGSATTRKHQGLVTSAMLALLFWGMVCGASGPEVAQQDFGKLEGAWIAVSGAQNGQQMPAEQSKTLLLIFKNGKVTVRNGDRILQRANVKLHAGDHPSGMDIEPFEGDQQGKKLLAIYEVADGALKICIADPGMPRPKAFKTEPGSSTSLFELRREQR